MTERDIRRAIIEALRSAGATVHPQTGAYGSRGTPDLLACYRGRFVAIEVKAPRGRLSELQAARIEAIRAAGGVAGVARSVDEALALLEEAANG